VGGPTENGFFFPPWGDNLLRPRVSLLPREKEKIIPAFLYREGKTVFPPKAPQSGVERTP